MDGKDILPVAKSRIGEKYVLGVAVTYRNASWTGPWDCAEFATWCVYQAYGILFGCDDKGTAGSAYSGRWKTDATARGREIPVGEAIATPGAFLLRYPGSGVDGFGHIVISGGDGTTIEAADTALGVIAGIAAGRRWDTGVLMPGVAYAVAGSTGADVLRYEALANPTPAVRAMQLALKDESFDPGPIDGQYGATTEAAVASFQAAKGLVVDGEFGPQSRTALYGADKAKGAAIPVAATAIPKSPAQTSDIAALRGEYAALFNGLSDRHADAAVAAAADRLERDADRYRTVSKGLGTGLVPWYAIGLVNELESGSNFKTHLHNGDPLSARTVDVPAGRPLTGAPPFTWEESALDALSLEDWDTYREWSLSSTLYRLEKYNGFGTRAHGIFTPYLWSGSAFYRAGKYKSDGTWDANEVSSQTGCAVILAELRRRGAVAIDVA